MQRYLTKRSSIFSRALEVDFESLENPVVDLQKEKQIQKVKKFFKRLKFVLKFLYFQKCFWRNVDNKVCFHLYVRIQYLCMRLSELHIVQGPLDNYGVHFSLNDALGPLGPLGPRKRAQTDLPQGSGTEGPRGPQLGPVSQKKVEIQGGYYDF